MLEHLNKTELLKPKRVVIIGAGGFVGISTTNNLIFKGIETVQVTRNEINLLKPNAAYSIAEFINSGDALILISAIAPCKNHQQLIKNLQMIDPICEVIAQRAEELSQIVYISSDAVYSDNITLANEKSIVQPNSMHGMMHAARELMIQTAANKANIPLAILRPSVLYGATDPHNSYGPNRFFRLALQNQDIMLFGGGEEKRDHVYIEDVAEIISQVLLHRSKGILNIATGHSISFRDIANKIVTSIKANINVISTQRTNAINHRHFDITACHQAFPKFIYTDLDLGFAKFIHKYNILQKNKEIA